MSAVRALRDKLGEDAMAGLHVVVGEVGRQWKDEVLTISGERFEKRLTQEIGTLRVDMAKAFAAVRVESAALRVDMAKEFAAVRADMAKEFAVVRADMAKEFAVARADMAKELAAVRTELNVGLAEWRASIVKWSFLFWVGQFAAVSAMMAFLLRAMGPR